MRVQHIDCDRKDFGVRKRNNPSIEVWRKYVHPEGVEPPTYSSVGCRSIQLSYGCKVFSYAHYNIQNDENGCKKPQAHVSFRLQKNIPRNTKKIFISYLKQGFNKSS